MCGVIFTFSCLVCCKFHFRAAAHVISITMIVAISKTTWWPFDPGIHLFNKCVLMQIILYNTSEIIYRRQSVRVLEMSAYMCEMIPCVSLCLIVCGMIAFRAFKAWRREFGKLTRLQSGRPKNILWKSQKEPVENDGNTRYYTVSYYQCDRTAAKIKYWLVSFLIF